MPIKLMYITNRPEVAEIADKNGVDRIFLDLEIIGKLERQGHLDTVISRHGIGDIAPLKESIRQAELLVRSNPIYDGSEKEIDAIVSNGADIVMLPFFKTVEEPKKFIEYVAKRAKTCLLFETPESVALADEILALDGIDEVYIGLNDLHLGYKMHFMFELLTNGTVDSLCAKFRKNGIPFGFGGIASMGQGLLPSEHVIAEHYRLGSTIAILSRSFCNTDKITEINKINESFLVGVKDIREYETHLLDADDTFFANNHKSVEQIVNKIVANATKEKNNDKGNA